MFLCCVIAYQHIDASWAIYAIFFLAPDLSFFGYLLGPKIGAIAYNSAHSYIGPLIALIASLTPGLHSALLVALIWASHVGFDRMLGYGLKYSAGFGFTHLGKIGKARST
ncbi:hypothetical protein Lysil_1375 [Lysobacter silvestris]|uniref:DUF4260 domain-containing protein n=1 Tax=Solilutibacter silvestris TaxID=1645665 RepID=A0A2K1Q3X3_9GAMM|nr:hypothetical protein Lysil_1375 [Lysobacter silvestris]